MGVEDCLLLNIYVSDVAMPESYTPNVKMPVLVWINGGAFILGSGKAMVNITVLHLNPAFL